MTGGQDETLHPEVVQRRASDPAASVWVGASAGTGKTRVLSDRVLRLMLGGTPPDRILCITFTKAAAAEMAIRVQDVLAGWITAADAALDRALLDLTGTRPDAALHDRARRLFAQVLDAPGGLKIMTIHAFCQSLLRRFPLEAGLPPHFEPIDERTSAELLHDTRAALFADPPPGLAAALAHLAGLVAEAGFDRLLAELIAGRGRLERLLERHGGAGQGGLAGLRTAVLRQLGLEHEDDAAVIAGACREAAFDGAGLRAAAGHLLSGSKTDRERGETVAAWLADPPGRAAAFETYSRAFLTKDGTVFKTLMTKALCTRSPAALAALEDEAARLLAVAGQCRAARLARATLAALTVGTALIEAYAAEKQRRALLDFDDLIRRAGTLLAMPGVAPWVLYKLDGGIDHLLVDEAQDTNPEQWAVIAALTEEFFAGEGGHDGARTVFAVGDEKQSIYGFQGADPAEFGRMRRHYAARAAAARQDWAAVELHVSFRSVAAVLETVDAVFAPAEVREGVTFDAAAPIEHRPFRRGEGGLVELWPPVGPVEAEPEEPWAPPVVQGRAVAPAVRLARRIAATVAGWLERGERLEASGRPIRPGDILVLVRKRDAFFAELVRALKECRVPVAGLDRMVLTDQLAVMDLTALAQFLLLPEDDLTLATVLKGPLIGFGEEEVFDLAHGRAGSLWDALTARAGERPRWEAARRYLAEELARADYVPPHELFAGVLAAPCPADPVSGKRAVLGRLGAEAEDPIDELLALALAFESTHPPSLQRFLAWLEAGQAEVKRGADPAGQQRLRIMTVHGAKGLQAPVVFLPDTMSVPREGPAILWPEGGNGLDVPLWVPRRDMEVAACANARAHAGRQRDREYRRLLYVALTRARDRMYLCGWHGKTPPPEGCWYRLCRTALDGMAGVERFEHAEYGGGAGVTDVWPGEGLRHRTPHTRPAPAPLPAAAAATPAPLLPEWARRTAPPEPEPARPLAPSRPAEDDLALRSPLGPEDGVRFRRGRLVHTLLQSLPEIDPAVRPAAIARFLARPVHCLSPDDQSALAREIQAVLDQPGFAPLFGPGSRAEVPITGLVGGRALSGQIDRLVVGDDEILVLDFKTNRPPPAEEAGVPPLYLRQMAAYRAALRGIYPGRPIRCALLWTDGPRLMPLSEAALDRQAP